MTLEHFGTPCELPIAKVVGLCEACNREIYDYERTVCECGAVIHEGCVERCAACGISGCSLCLLEDVGDWFCDTNSDKQLLSSDCYKSYQGEV